MRKYLFVILLGCGLWSIFSCGPTDLCQTDSCSNGQVCLEGKCQCPLGQLACSGVCTDTKSSSAHCGACGSACGVGQQCRDGLCTAITTEACPSPLRPHPCGALCVNLQSDNQHCGSCQQACQTGKQCIEGQCQCPSLLKECNQDQIARCVDLDSDKLHCGACGRACSQGKVCDRGRCLNECPEPTRSECYGGCFDRKNSRLHCGICGNACPLDQPCIEGKCNCPPDWQKCDGQCIDPKTNWEHCGACKNECQGGQKCAEGRCIATCPATTPSNCNGGCFDLQANTHHCGKCHNTCLPGQICQGGKCLCPRGESICGVACTDLQTDDSHCGACGSICAPGQRCQQGKCTCPQGQTACGPTCVDIQSDPDHCGTCNKPCDNGKSCAKGTCQSGHACPTPEIFCVAGCVDPNTSQEHCGTCNRSCPSNQRCEAGTCLANNTCQEGQTQPCSTTQPGICKAGTQTCTRLNGKLQWANCTSNATPTKEICDNQDNNCDGQIDEALTQPCYTGPKATQGKGVCKAGTQTCQAGKWGICQGEQTPSTEICNNGIDEDCDGQSDEGCPPCSNNQTQSCYSGPSVTQGKGVCKDGTQTCKAGKWQACAGEVTPKTEICDNIDNDCDGRIDGIPSQACYTGTAGTLNRGPCRSGTQSCNNGKWSACIGETKPSTEKCDGVDNDCDGQTDEDFLIGSNCTVGTGQCTRTGKRICDTNGGWKCNATAGPPTTEICDGYDNDCDGQIDEGLTIRVCYSGPPGTFDKGLCRYGTQTCKNGAWGACLGESTPKTEICDGYDNDCDGQTDEDWPNLGKSCQYGISVSGSSCVFPGTYQCKTDKSGDICVTPYNISPEVCDGIDNDCNGTIDDNPTDLTGFCTVYIENNQCVHQKYLCTNGKRVCEQRSIKTRCANTQTPNSSECIAQQCPSTHTYCNSNGICVKN